MRETESKKKENIISCKLHIEFYSNNNKENKNYCSKKKKYFRPNLAATSLGLYVSNPLLSKCEQKLEVASKCLTYYYVLAWLPVAYGQFIVICTEINNIRLLSVLLPFLSCQHFSLYDLMVNIAKYSTRIYCRSRETRYNVIRTSFVTLV